MSCARTLHTWTGGSGDLKPLLVTYKAMSTEFNMESVELFKKGFNVIDPNYTVTNIQLLTALHNKNVFGDM